MVALFDVNVLFMAQFYMLLCLLWLIIELYMYLHFLKSQVFVTKNVTNLLRVRNISEFNNINLHNKPIKVSVHFRI